ncbi:type II toxin-antitoxin system RelE/ParE family toxin [uncultured Mucilaginibacter sp.]|uniref:type II toxin-antitoxin system RelE/ParE family toxin n=1 Tax=uncultured Mucilaginibacter sp. TaxID=797541 RepID=UPI0026381A66|nr:type II toxin-antitoxin system RelE/ParE family toxin [uncultured Mucilaginibacter sp.]
MNYEIATIPIFDKQAKRLGKKHPSFKNDLAQLIASLTTEPNQGKPLGNNFFKIRLAIASKNKGKSGGVRIITYLKITATTVYLASVYDKSKKSTITDKELEQIFKTIL